MDKKSELALLKRRNAPQPEATTATAAATLPPPDTAAEAGAAAPTAAQARTGWWMYHGDPEHTGYVSDSDLTSAYVNPASFTTLHTLQLGGPVLSVPAVADGFVYVGTANYQLAEG